MAQAAWAISWSDDGEILHAFRREGSAVFDLGTLAVDGDPLPREVLALGSSAVPRAEWSPDKRWLAYESAESGRSEIYVRPYPEVDSGRRQVSSAGGEEPHWSPDGNALYFMGPRDMMRAVVETGESFRFVTPAPLFAKEDYLVDQASPRRFDVAEDGQRLLMIRVDTGLTDGSIDRPIVVLNWFEDLRRLVPTE